MLWSQVKCKSILVSDMTVLSVSLSMGVNHHRYMQIYEVTEFCGFLSIFYFRIKIHGQLVNVHEVMEYRRGFLKIF